jgi:hypothetical protein
MKSHLRLVLLAGLVILWPLQSRAQDKPSAAETVENLKLQLIDVKAREDDLKYDGSQATSICWKK